LPEFRADLAVLAAARWPVVGLTSLAIVLIYLWARSLWGSRIALLGAAFIALDPHTLSLSRIIGHDAPVTIFMTLALLALLRATTKPASFKPGWLGLSGLMAGLAFLSKSPAFFLIPFAALLLWVKLRRPEQTGQEADNQGHTALPATVGGGGLKRWLQAMLIWSLVAYGVFIIVWPAAWVAPLQQPFAVLENAFRSATSAAPDLDEAAVEQAQETDNYWLVPDWGPLYYLVNGAFKLSPLIFVGLILFFLFCLRGNPKSMDSQRRWWQQLA